MTTLRLGFDLTLTEEDRAFAREFLNEVEEDVPVAIAELRDWAKHQSHFKCPLHDDFLLIFLRNAKFSQERARELLENHVRIRVTQSTSAYSKEAVIDKTTELLAEYSLGAVLPGLALDGSRVVIYRPKIGGLDLTFMDCLRTFAIIYDILLSDPAVQLHGITFLGDYKGLGLKCYAKHGLNDIKTSMETMCHYSAHKMAGLHVVHTAPIVRGIHAFIKSIMPHSVFALVKVHGNSVQNLQHIVAPENLPNELGGTAGSYEELTNNWMTYAREQVQHLDWLDKFEYKKPAN